MATQQLQLADFMSLFTGNIHNYGAHEYAYAESGKEEGKNSTVTNKLLTVEQYKAHLNGQMGLGIIPIGDDNKCSFGVIDIDVYSDLTLYLQVIDKGNLPLVPFRSKSGGLHLYMFLKTPTDAKIVVELLNAFVALLGLDLFVKQKMNKIIEVFPKQQRLQEGRVGNWINLPYYNAKEPKQYAMLNGKPLALDDALALIKTRRRAPGEVRAFLDDVPFNNGPPCLQTLHLLNPLGANSGRNNYLFSFGVYLKKLDESFWEQKLFEVNGDMLEPLPRDEVEGTIIESLRKKDYTYKCFDQPCVDFCRRAVCKTRDYGIGKEGGYFSELEYGKLTQVKTDEPYYEWEVRIQGEEKFSLLRFRNEEEIIKQDAFLRLCFRELHLLPIKMKQSEWFKLINQALAELKIQAVEREDDTSPHSLFRQLFVDFLTGRAMAQNKGQILNKRVFLDTRQNVYYFRTIDLNEYLFVTKNFRYFAPSEIHGLLADLKATPTRIKAEGGKQFRVYQISQKDVTAVISITDEPFVANFEAETEKEEF